VAKDKKSESKKGTEDRTEDPGPKTTKTRPEGILVVKGNPEKADAAVKDGGIDTTFFIEAHGNDQEAVAQALKNTLLVDLKKEAGVTLREMKFHPVVEQNKLYAGFVECSFVVRDPQTFMYIALRYGPSAVEVHAPDNVVLTSAELQNMAADLSAAIQVLIGKILERTPQEEKDRLFNQKIKPQK